MNHKIDRDTYIIPPNFIESGTFFGGMFKARNVIEAGILAFAIGVPVFSLLPLGLTARIIALCLTALPAALVALIGVSGESLSSFLLIFIKYLRNRRIVGGNSAEDVDRWRHFNYRNGCTSERQSGYRKNWFGCRTLQRSMVRCAGRRLAMKKLLQP